MEHHRRGLRRAWDREGLSSSEQQRRLETLSDGVADIPWSQAEQAMLRYVIKLTRTPHAITAADVDLLRDQGFDDRAIHDICSVAAYFGFVNRIADGLGVELET